MERKGEITYSITEEEYEDIKYHLRNIKNYFDFGDNKEGAILSLNNLKEKFEIS